MNLPLDEILQGDVRDLLPTLPAASVDCVVTSPPYWALRDYGVAGQLGLEPSWREHLAALRPIFAEIHRVLKPSGNLFVNYGDTVATGAGGSRNPGSRADPMNPQAQQPANAPNRLSSSDPKKHKLGLHYRLRFMLNDDFGFISRADIVWHKPNQMPLSVKDRVTPKHEMMFHLVKQPQYWFDLDPIRRAVQDDRERAFGGPEKGAPEGARPLPAQRLDNTWEARRARVKPGQKGAAPGQKPQSTQRFNVRVRDAKKGIAEGKWGDLGVRASDAEMETYQEGNLGGPRRNKTLDAPELKPAQKNGLRLRPEEGEEGGPDENGHYHALGANPGDVWTIPSQPLDEAHFATFPEELVRRCVASGCPPGGIVLDPFMGSGTTALVAKRLGRHFIGCELNPAYVEIAMRRISPAMNQRLDLEADSA